MAFATAEDVATRLGRSLTAAEVAFAEQVIEAVTGQIVDVVGFTAEWAAGLDPVPPVLQMLCVEKVILVGANPSGVASESEALGAWSHSKTFPRTADMGIFLTAEEERKVRRAVWGNLGRSVGVETAYSGTSELSALDFWPLPSP